MKNNAKAIVFFDLDGTLLTRDIKVADSTVKAVKKLRENNILPIIATGRSLFEIEHIMHHTGINSIVSMNGQSVIFEGKPIFSNDIDPQIIDRILQFSHSETGIPIAFYNDYIMRISELGEPATKFYHYLQQTIPPVDDKIHYQEPIQMLLLLCESGEEIYRDVFPELSFVRNTPYCVDVINAESSKAFGIKKLLQKAPLQNIPTYAFGDGFNDIEMFEIVDHPIAMANAVTPLKQLAEFITDDNNHDGIVKGLQRAGLI